MIDARTDSSSEDGWHEYWRHTRESAAHRRGGPQDEVLARFWSGFFDAAFVRLATPRVLDLACGNGAVARHALAAASRRPPSALHVVGLDSARSALQGLRRRNAQVDGVVGSASCTPFADGAFDVVASQFGLEYGGRGAFVEALRLVRSGGVFAAIVHMKDGGIHRECAANLVAVAGVRESKLLDRTAHVLKTGHAARRGRVSKAAFRRAEADFATAVLAVEEILRRHGNDVAGGSIHRLHADVTEMVRRLAAYDPASVEDWVRRMTRELDAYAGRMSSMLAAAVDAERVAEMQAQAAARGFTVELAEPVAVGERAEPAAWALVCARTA